jgi:hypothetical protein
MTNTITVDCGGKSYTLRRMSKYLYARMAAAIADCGDSYHEALTRTAYKLLPFVLESCEGMPAPTHCEYDGIPMQRVSPTWVSENIDLETAVTLMNAARETSEISEGERKN